jgi:hypothetical protein
MTTPAILILIATNVWETCDEEPLEDFAPLYDLRFKYRDIKEWSTVFFVLYRWYSPPVRRGCRFL